MKELEDLKSSLAFAIEHFKRDSAATAFLHASEALDHHRKNLQRTYSLLNNLENIIKGDS